MSSLVGYWRKWQLAPIAASFLFLLGLIAAYVSVIHNVDNQALFGDSLAYWNAGQGLVEPYSLPPGSVNAYLYSPAFLQVISLLTWLPWNVFAVLWCLLCLIAYAWLLKPLGWMWGSVALVWCIPELARGNIIAFLAVAVVFGLQGKPAAWAFPFLTKPIFGVGLLWFAIRKEWRSLFIASAVTGSIALVSFILNPHAWSSWFAFLADNSGSTPSYYPLRIVLAVLLIVYAARKNHAWLIPVALLLCTPVFGGYPVLMILAAIPRLVRRKPPAMVAVQRQAELP